MLCKQAVHRRHVRLRLHLGPARWMQVLRMMRPCVICWALCDVLTVQAASCGLSRVPSQCCALWWPCSMRPSLPREMRRRLRCGSAWCGGGYGTPLRGCGITHGFIHLQCIPCLRRQQRRRAPCVLPPPRVDGCRGRMCFATLLGCIRRCHQVRYRVQWCVLSSCRRPWRLLRG